MIRSGRSPTRPRSAKRTQSTGVPSVANPREPSRSSTSVTVRARSMVMPRPTALRFESGAMTETSPTSSSACLAAKRPREVMPSSFVSRMRIGREGYAARRYRAGMPTRGPAYRIVTPRLVVRCWEPRDAPLLKEAIDSSLDHLRPWMPWAKHEPQTLAEKVELLREFRGQFDLGADSVYAIFDSGDQRVLGGSGLHPRIGPGALEIGYWIRADAVGRGYATESTAALNRVAFEVAGVERVEIHCAAENHASA